MYEFRLGSWRWEESGGITVRVRLPKTERARAWHAEVYLEESGEMAWGAVGLARYYGTYEPMEVPVDDEGLEWCRAEAGGGGEVVELAWEIAEFVEGAVRKIVEPKDILGERGERDYELVELASGLLEDEAFESIKGLRRLIEMRQRILEYRDALDPCASNGDLRDVAAWMDEFTIDEARRWSEAGVFDAVSAETLRLFSYTPDDVSVETDEGLGGYRGTVGYKFANGDIALEDVRRIVGESRGEG